MEPAKIDWNRIESVFVEDKVYENINAPKWVDLLAPDEVHANDEAWFCRPDCKHPKTVEDFFKTPPSLKISRSIERVPFGERNQRDARLKRREQSQTSFSSNVKPTNFNEDCENQNPNSATPQNHVRSLKAAVNSSSEKNNKQINDTSQNDEILPRLKATLSASNLFAGRDILSHITEFCNEMKKLTTRAREKENVDKLNEKKDQEGEKMAVENENSYEILGELDGREKERNPLLEVVNKQKSGSEIGSVKDKQRRKKSFDELENIPVSLNLENVKNKGMECLLQIRTNPPSPQCFSATRTAMRTTPTKSFAYRSMVENRILEEVEQNKAATKDGIVDKGKSISVVEGGGEARALDVFWFLKPCALSG